MTNLMKNVGYPILLAIGFLVLRFILAFAVSPLGASMSAASLSYLFWGIQVLVLLLVLYWLWRRGDKVAVLVTIVLVLLSFGFGPMD